MTDTAQEYVTFEKIASANRRAAFIRALQRHDRDLINREAVISTYKWVKGQSELKAAGKPSEWDQRFWIRERAGTDPDVVSCGTACCIAGHIALEAGAQRPPDEGWGQIAVIDDRQVCVPDYAAGVLGISNDMSDPLFHSQNSFEDLRFMMSQLVGTDIDLLV